MKRDIFKGRVWKEDVKGISRYPSNNIIPKDSKNAITR